MKEARRWGCHGKDELRLVWFLITEIFPDYLGPAPASCDVEACKHALVPSLVRGMLEPDAPACPTASVVQLGNAFIPKKITAVPSAVADARLAEVLASSGLESLDAGDSHTPKSANCDDDDDDDDGDEACDGDDNDDE